MKKITLLFALLLATFSWQANAQAVNQAANWPNTNWAVNEIAHTGATAQDVEANPTTDANFAYDDDDTGRSSHDEIAAESPVIDLTAAQTAGENFIQINGTYVYNYINANEILAIQYWDADASAWTDLYVFPQVDTAGAPTDNYCGGTYEDYKGVLNISAFTATQLSGFKYRFYYSDDNAGGNGWRWGFCFSSPTVVSTPYYDPAMTLLLSPDCANSNFSVTVDVTDLGGANSVTVADDQGSATQQLTVAGQLTFGPYASGTTVNFTVTSDTDNTFTSTDVVTYTCPTVNDDCFNADALTVYPFGGGAGNETSLDTSADYTDSGVHSTCDTAGTNLDAWYTVTVPAGKDGFKAIYTGTQAANVESALWDGCGGAQISCFNHTAGALQVFSGLTAGQTYYLQLWTDDFNAGDFTVVIEELPDAPNCASNPVPADAATAVPVLSGRKVVLSWDAPTTGNIPDSYKIELGTVSGTYPISGTISGTSVPFTGVEENTTYYWKVTPIFSGVEAIGCTEWSFTTDAYPAAPANDACPNAIALTVDPDACVTPTIADNSFATDSGEAAPSCSTYSGGDLWYTVTVPASGAITVETSAAANSFFTDSAMSIYSGDCTGLVEVSCDDDSGDANFSKIELTGQTAGDILYVRIFAYQNARFGEFNVCAWDPLASSVADNQIKGFEFYPNPVNHTLNLSAQDNIEKVSIFSISGQEVISVMPNALQTQVDMSRLQNGIYFVKAQVNGQLTAFKVVKK